MSPAKRPRNDTTKPVLDAVIEAVAALSGLARSLRERAPHPVRETKKRLKSAGREAKRFGKRIGREAKEAVAGRSQRLAETLVDLRQRTKAARTAFRDGAPLNGEEGERPRTSRRV